MQIIFHILKPQFFLLLALLILQDASRVLMANEQIGADRALPWSNLEGNSFKDIWIWLLLLWAAKIISKKKSSHSSGLPLFDSYREDETKGRPSKT